MVPAHVRGEQHQPLDGPARPLSVCPVAGDDRQTGPCERPHPPALSRVSRFDFQKDMAEANSASAIKTHVSRSWKFPSEIIAIYRQNNSSRIMIGSGTPISQSKAPRPSPITLLLQCRVAAERTRRRRVPHWTRFSADPRPRGRRQEIEPALKARVDEETCARGARRGDKIGNEKAEPAMRRSRFKFPERLPKKSRMWPRSIAVVLSSRPRREPRPPRPPPVLWRTLWM